MATITSALLRDASPTETDGWDYTPSTGGGR
jgi:hypothetical protein